MPRRKGNLSPGIPFTILIGYFQVGFPGTVSSLDANDSTILEFFRNPVPILETCTVKASGNPDLPETSGFLAAGFPFQTKSAMQRSYPEFQVFFIDHDANLYFRGGNHLDINSFIGQRLEHGTGNACM